MVTPIHQFTGIENWERIYDTTLYANTVAGTSAAYTPIPVHNIPVIIDRFTLVVGASSTQTKPTWQLAFWLAMQVRMPGVGTGEAASRFIRLGLTLVRFPPVASEYRLRCRIPRWHREMTMTVWKYIGDEVDEPFVVI